MTTTVIPYTIRPSCRRHRKLFRRQIPHSHGITLTEQELFTYATLKLQDSSLAQRMTFADTTPLFSALRAQHGIYLQLQPQGILCTAVLEDLTAIAEVMGVGCGIAAIVSSLSVNPNRFSRILRSGKRLDFEFRHNGKACQLECKGTSYGNNLKGMLRATKKKKRKTSLGFDAAFGAITVFATPNRHNLTQVIVVDPPTGSGGTRAIDVPEQAIVLRHYLPYIQAALTPNAFTEWLLTSLVAFESGKAPPEPTGARPLPRVREGYGNHGTFLGTIFDARFTTAAANSFETFDNATHALGDASTFVGLHEDVVLAMARGDWDQLLALSWPSETSEGVALLRSGVITKRIDLSSAELPILRASFDVARRQALRRRLLAGTG